MRLGDGYCDDDLNVRGCADNGDCCATCTYPLQSLCSVSAITSVLGKLTICIIIYDDDVTVVVYFVCLRLLQLV